MLIVVAFFVTTIYHGFALFEMIWSDDFSQVANVLESYGWNALMLTGGYGLSKVGTAAKSYSYWSNRRNDNGGFYSGRGAYGYGDIPDLDVAVQPDNREEMNEVEG